MRYWCESAVVDADTGPGAGPSVAERVEIEAEDGRITRISPSVDASPGAHLLPLRLFSY
jgi:hypothetical protein